MRHACFEAITMTTIREELEDVGIAAYRANLALFEAAKVVAKRTGLDDRKLALAVIGTFGAPGFFSYNEYPKYEESEALMGKDANVKEIIEVGGRKYRLVE